MVTPEDIQNARDRLIERQRRDPSLGNHEIGQVNWFYDGDRHIEAREPREIIFFGLNPGGGVARPDGRMCRSERVYKNRCIRLAEVYDDTPVFGELIFTSSANKTRLRGLFPDLRPAFEAAAAINRLIIAHHNPNLVLQAGIGDLSVVSELYCLRCVATAYRPAHPTNVLVKHLERTDGRPWLAFMHFATPGLSKADLLAMRENVVSVMKTGRLVGKPPA